MRLSAFAVSALPLLLGFACERPPVATPQTAPVVQVVSQAAKTQLMEDIRWMADPAREGRRAGTPGEEATAAWLEARFQAHGLKPFTQAGLEGFQQAFPLGSSQGHNVIGVLPGVNPTSYVIVSAHYDHLGKRGEALYPGADDDASGIAVMLESLRALTASPAPPSKSVVFVAFSAEELGMVGSRALAALLKEKGLTDKSLCLNLEMFGPIKEAARVMDVWDQGREGLGDMLKALQAAGSRHQLEVVVHHERDPGSDALALSHVGIPAACAALAGTRRSLKEAHPHYHKPTDLPEHLDADALGRGAQVVAEALKALVR